MQTELEEVVFVAGTLVQLLATDDLLLGEDSRILGNGAPETEQPKRSVEEVGLFFQDACVEWLKLKPAGKGRTCERVSLLGRFG